MYRLIIGNKNYSSWSLRAWLALKGAGIPFDETVIPLDRQETADEIARYSGAGRVPILIDGDLTVWESLAIIEYLAERHPEAGIWPASARARAVARAVSNEMHAGFASLRSALHMNIQRPARPHPGGIAAPVAADIARVCEIWRAMRAEFGADGPFLFGRFSAADAMFAPVATRFRTYAIDVGPGERAYMDSVLALPALAEWQSAAALEPWTIAAEEVD
jgi:glutathione S-transferase